MSILTLNTCAILSKNFRVLVYLFVKGWFPILTLLWKLKKISLRQWTLSEELAFSLFPSSNQLPISFTLIHLSYFLSPSLSSIRSALFCSSWFYMGIGGLDVESVPGCSPVWSGLWRPAIVTTLWGQEIHWLIRCYFSHCLFFWL